MNRYVWGGLLIDEDGEAKQFRIEIEAWNMYEFLHRICVKLDIMSFLGIVFIGSKEGEMEWDNPQLTIN